MLERSHETSPVKDNIQVTVQQIGSNPLLGEKRHSIGNTSFYPNSFATNSEKLCIGNLLTVKNCARKSLQQ